MLFSREVGMEMVGVVLDSLCGKFDSLPENNET
jgi:hypothetical protein